MLGLILSGALAILAIALGRWFIARIVSDPEGDARRAAEVTAWNA